MKIKLTFLVFLVGLGAVRLAAHGEEKVGLLVDAVCIRESFAGATSPDPARCPVSPDVKSFGIVSEGEFLPFDDYGNRQARLLLKTLSGQANPKVRVGGHFEDGIAKVSELETVP